MKKKILSIMMSILLIVAMGGTYKSYAAPGDDLDVNLSVQSVNNGTMSAEANVTVHNNTDSEIKNIKLTVKADKAPGGASPEEITIPGLASGTTSQKYTFFIDTNGIPMGNDIYATAVATWEVSQGNVKSVSSKAQRFEVRPGNGADIGKPNLPTPGKDNSFKPDTTINYNSNAKLEVIFPETGLNAGDSNVVKLKVKNTGNAPFNKVLAGITLGEGMSLQSGSTEKDLGKMNISAEGTATFPVFVNASHTGGNVPITFTVKATDPTGKENTFTSTEYVVVNGGNSMADRLEITNISNPKSVGIDQTFTLKFSVRNNSSNEAKNIKVTVEPTAPVVNKSKNIFVVSLAGGEAKAFSVDMFAVGNAEIQTQNYPIKITAETMDKEPTSISQYAGVLVNAGSNAKTVPQIIISNYKYGGDAVVANEVFPLSLSLKNTNTSQTVKNIKVSFSAEEGVFIPYKTSNSFYVASIGAGGEVAKTVDFMTKPDAAEKTMTMNVDISYEDSKGNPVTVKEIISIPVVQQRRLVIDDVSQGDAIFMGQPASLNVQYYNMGKSTLNNLVITAEGDFDFANPPKVFVGKFDPGKSEFYDMQIVATKVGEAKGKVIFTFEDANGKQIKTEKEFTITAEEFVAEDPGAIAEEPQKKGLGLGAKIGIGVLVAGATTFTILKIRKNKKKKMDSLNIDND